MSTRSPSRIPSVLAATLLLVSAFANAASPGANGAQGLGKLVQQARLCGVTDDKMPGATRLYQATMKLATSDSAQKASELEAAFMQGIASVKAEGLNCAEVVRSWSTRDRTFLVEAMKMEQRINTVQLLKRAK